MGIRIVTDSTADLSPEIRKEHGVEMVPLTVHFGPESFKAEVDMDIEGFWRKLDSSSHHPKSAQPSPGDFMEVYKPILDAGDEILSLHISSKLSGTVSSAHAAMQILEGDRIKLIDTLSCSLGLGMMVIHAARMAKEGKSVAEITASVQAIADRTHIFFSLNTLDFLQKNGRVGKAQAFIGGLLGIKPILQLDREGIIAPADKVRGKSKVMPRTLELMAERIPAGREINLGVVHAQSPADAKEWIAKIKQVYKVKESYLTSIGPVIAANVGPGAIGVLFHEV